MKRYINITKLFLFAATTFIASSCSMIDDLLSEEKLGSYTADTFYTNETNALNGLIRAYGIQCNPDYTGRALIHIMEASTDMYESYGFSPDQTTSWFQWDINPTDTWELDNLFKYIALGVNEANTVYENVEGMATSQIGDDVRSQIMGEARFLRAYHYFNAVRIWGDFPLHSKAVTAADDGIITYTPISGVYDFIIADLEEAIDLMKIQKIQSRVDKVGAQFLLAKVYLTLASSKETGARGYDWVESAEDMYALSLEYSREVVYNQTSYGLEPDINNVYSVDHEDSIEHLWITEHSPSGKYNAENLPMMFAANIKNKHIVSDVTVSYTPGANLSADDVERYLPTDQGGWPNYTVSRSFYNSFDDDDYRKRLMATTLYDEYGQVIVEWSETNYSSGDSNEKLFYFPMCTKYTDQWASDYNTSIEFYLMRFAEALLTHAEAAGNTTEGYESLNAVRERAGLQPLSGLNDEEYQEAVWEEFDKELAFESHALALLRRTNRVKEKIVRGSFDIEAFSNNYSIFEKYADFFPIPQREQDLNPQESYLVN